MLVGRVLASEKAFAEGFCAPITHTSTVALTKPSTRETRVPDAMTALARPMPLRGTVASAIARLGRGIRRPTGATPDEDEPQQARDEDEAEHEGDDEGADALPFGVHGDARAPRVEHHAGGCLERGEHGHLTVGDRLDGQLRARG